MSKFKVGDKVSFVDIFDGRRASGIVTGFDNAEWLEVDVPYADGTQRALDPEEDEIHLETQANPGKQERTEAQKRKDQPLYRGLLCYFPDACLAVAELSRIGNDQHNPGEPMHWARGKSMDQGDCILRHQIDVGTVDTDGVRHATKVAWRALAQLQLELEAADPELAAKRSK